MTMLRLLRGRVMIAPITEKKVGLIIRPDQEIDKRTNANSLGMGEVLMIGDPAITPLRWDAKSREWRGGHEVRPEFKVGDTVKYVGQHHSRYSEWAGEFVVFVAQEEVQAVIE